MPEVLVTPAIDTPVSLDEAKLFLRVTHNQEDIEIQSVIEDATRYLEDWLGQAFLTSEWIVTQPCFNDTCILIPRPPLQTIDEISYVDANGTTQVLATSEYQVDVLSMPGRIMPADGKFWPSLRPGVFNPVTIEYTAGYASVANVPGAIKRALKLIIGHWYTTREPVSDRPSSKVEETLDALRASVWHGGYAGLR